MALTIIADQAGLAARQGMADAVVSARPAEPVISGHWGDDSYHSGYAAYLLHRDPGGVWVLVQEVRNTCLDDVTEEDVEAGNLNDDQLQALDGSTLAEAQNAV
jgi:hypothetical protein